MTLNRFGLVICLAFSVVSLNGQELSLLNRIEIAKPVDTVAPEPTRYFVGWVTDSDVVSFGRDLKIQLIDTSNSNVKWVREWRDGVRSWSVSKSKRRLAISTPHNGVTVFNCDDGATILSVTNKWLAKKTGAENLRRVNVTLSSVDGRLIVANSSPYFGPNAFLFSERLDEVEKVIDIDGAMKIATSTDGKRLVCLALASLLSVRNIDNNSDVFLSGVRPDEIRLPPDGALMFSDAFHDGLDTIVYAKGGLCFGNGEIGVHSLTKKETVIFDSLSGWVQMDVDFRTQRIAAAGSSNVTVFDFDGKVVASLKNATGSKYDGIEFSPNAEKLMVYNGGSINVFRIRSKANEKQAN